MTLPAPNPTQAAVLRASYEAACIEFLVQLYRHAPLIQIHEPHAIERVRRYAAAMVAARFGLVKT